MGIMSRAKPFSYRRLLLLWLALLVGGGLLQVIGKQTNTFVEDHNDDQMPVWQLRKSMALMLAVDPWHCRLTRDSRYIMLCDVIPTLDFTVDGPTVCMSSVGDAFIFAGDFLLKVLPFYTLYLIARAVRRLIYVQEKRGQGKGW